MTTAYIEQLSNEALKALKVFYTQALDARGRAWFIHKPKSRRLVISDIHGCYQTFEKLLQKINLTLDDQLFIAGDLVNRGPYSLMVLMRVWKLLTEGHMVLPLRGNHEQLLLECNREHSRKLTFFAERQYSAHIVKDGDLPEAIDQFLIALPYYYETPDAFVVHAGFATALRNPFAEWKEMLWVRQFEYDERKLKGKRVVHGHVPESLEVIEACAKRRAKEVDVDNGCVRAAFPGYGKLVCFDLDSGKITTQKNADLRPY